MSRKAGIVSLYIGQNFGNKLQNYAVEKILETYGFLPETFRYEVDQTNQVVTVPLQNKLSFPYMRSYMRVRLSRFLPMKNSDSSFLEKLIWLTKQDILRDAKKRQAEAYKQFDERYLHFSNRTIGLNETNEPWTEDYAFFFCGSDQVWNPYYQTTGANCFLQFAPKEKRVTLAPSFGVSAIPEERKADFAKWISEIPYLSVREEAGMQIIRNLTGRDAAVLVDPTMVLSVEEWEKFAKKPLFELPGRYILTYFLGDRTKKYGKEIRRHAKECDCQVINLLDLMEPQYYGCSPNEFVYCIKNAEMVCTDSFHAAVFSILFHKEFQVFERVEGDRRMSSRLQTLLGKFGMQEKMYGYETENECGSYEQCDKLLQIERKKLQNYLYMLRKDTVT